jgi:hypothetical protein
MVDLTTRKLPHAVFSFWVTDEVTLARERKIMSVFKVNMTFPGPWAGSRVETEHAVKELIAVWIWYPADLPVSIKRFHRVCSRQKLHSKLVVFINPRFTGFDSDDFGFIPTLARMNRLKHLKLPAALYAPTDIDSQLPGPAGIVQVGRSDDKKISIKQVRHSRPRRFSPGRSAQGRRKSQRSGCTTFSQPKNGPQGKEWRFYKASARALSD